MNDKTDVELHLLDKDTSKQPKSHLDQTNKSPFIDFVDLNPSPTKYRPVTSILSYIFFADTFPLAKYVNNKKGDIENKELPLPYHDYNIERKVHLMDQGWFAEKDPQKRSIIKALFKGFKTEIFISIVLLLLTCTGHLVTTMLLGSIISMITQYNLGSDLQFDEIMPMAVWFAVLYFLTQALETWIGHFDFIIGAEMRLAITGLIYKKFQSVSLNSLQEANVGKIMNVITNDLSEFDYGYGFVFPTLFSPYNILIACYVMWSYFQAYTIISVVCLAFFLFFAIYLSNRSEAPRKEKNAMTDKRVQLTNELIDSIRLIKQYAWEEYFEKAIQTFRLREVVALLKLGNIEANGRTITESSVYLCTLITCITYVSFGGILDPEKVYATMMILNFLRYWAILFFHDGRMFLVNLRVMTPRIHDVLNLKDVLAIEETTKNFREYQAPEGGREPIQFKNFTGYASSNAQKPCLRDLNLTIEPKKLTAVIGKIGSGKSSLLNAFLKEIPRTTGKLTYRGSLAYVEQEPIIFSGTLKENILFGKSYDHELYRKVLRACNWDQDFKQLPYKDATVIGQRGVTLSGGQKARLSLARALYSESDIYLLDDPLSAVDSQVARHVFKHAIKGILKDKTVILVTHHLTYAREADRVVVLNEGQVEAQGSFAELQNLNIGLMELFKEENVVEKVEKIEEKNPVQVQEPILSRKSSIMSDRKMSRFNEEEILEPQGQETKEESIMVTWQTYKSYLRASGKWGFMWTIFGLYLLCQLFIFGFTRFLGYWADLQNEAALLGDEENFSNTPYIWSCIALCCGIMLTYNLKISYTIKFLTETNSNLHKKMLWSLIRAVVPFFDKVSAGQILNRFSGDIGILDKQNWLIVFDLIDGVIYAGFFIGYLCVVSYTMIFPSIIVVFILFKVRNYFQRPSIELKRVDLISRSPVYSELTSTLNGLLIIRIYNQGGRHIKKFLDLIYDNSRAFLYNARTTRSFMITLKIFLYILTISGIFIFIGIAYYGSLESGVFGLTLLYLLEIANKSVWIIRQTLFLDINMQSAQRLLEYCNLPEEPPQHTSKDSTVQTNSEGKWPNKGELQFNNVVLRYNSIDKPALRGITFEIPPRTKVGVVGRTGAGKSSIVQALFRMVEIDKQIDSSIKIDGVNIQELGLQFLRKNLAIIPQTPVLFIGTIKKNIDPFEEFSDHAIWEVLERINLKSLIEDLEKQLDTEIDSKSSLFSTGQKQLICLARAMLRRSKIVMLDEATANIDIETDKLIQQQLKEYFRECTVLTIAHRLNNIADYDKVLVIDQGVAVEYDEPYKLLVRREGDQNITNQEGHFAKMVLSGGEAAAREIFNIAYRKSQSSK